MTDMTLSESSYSAVINLPVEQIDIAEWLFSLPTAEYQRCCPPDHIAAGATWSDDGRRMSINVETIGTTLMIQQYVGEVTEPAFCRMVSQSTVITPHGRTRTEVTWELSVKKIDDTSCEYTNRVHANATPDFLEFLKANGQTLDEARAARQAASGDHNSRETPLFAASIGRRAAARAALKA